MNGGYWFLLFALACLAYSMYRNGRLKRIAAAFQSGWHCRWSVGVPEKPSRQGDGFWVDVPVAGAGHLNDVILYKGPSLIDAKSITLRGHITGDGFKIMEDFKDGRPATATFILQRKGDNYTAVGMYQSFRWYSKQMIELKAGEFELTVPLNATAMGDIMGGHDEGQFDAAMSNLLGFGLGFGSAGGRAHGICTTQSARFTLSSYTINR